MPFQPINFANIEPQGSPLFRNLIQTLTEGYKAGQMPFKMKRDAEGEELKNALSRMKVQEEPERFEAWKTSQPLIDALRQSEAQLKTRNANNPFYGAPSGAAQDIYNLQAAEKMWGPDSPQVEQIKKNINLQQAGKQSQINYQNVLSESAPKRFSTQMGKLLQERQDIDNGFRPGTQDPITPEQQEELANQYDLKILKENTDAGVRQLAIYAKNAKITGDRIIPDDLFQYSGIEGQAKLKKDQALSAIGQAPENYKKYLIAKNHSQTWAKQLRQSWKDSIQPANAEKIESFTDPTTWYNSPEAAKEAFEAFKTTADTELGNIEGALHSKKVYEKSAPLKKATMRYNPATGMLETIK